MDVGMEYEILMLQLGSLARKLFNAEENLSKYQEALEKAREIVGSDASIAAIPDGVSVMVVNK